MRLDYPETQGTLRLGKGKGDTMELPAFNIDSTEQLSDVMHKLKAYRQSLQGQAKVLAKREATLKTKELQVKLYRKQLLLAIREQLSEQNSYSENMKILEKYHSILHYVADDMQEDIDTIMA
jgi:hypothetical protein